MIKKQDLFIVLFIILLFFPFMLFNSWFHFFELFTKNYPLIASFIKFAVLATLGESIGLRIRTGYYNYKGFGLLPRAIVWGFLGIAIFMSFVIFSEGTPKLLTILGVKVTSTLSSKILFALAISTMMNLIFAPVMMTLHKVTDTHIVNQGGSISGFFKPINFVEILQNIDWKTHWNFVLKKTIPFFWIPAHTVTFLLPSEFRVLFAAILGVLLGIILSVANKNK